MAGSRGWYNPHWHYDNEPETRAALDLIFSDHFSRNEPGVFTPLRDALLTHGDYYMHLADLKSYLEADQRLRELYADPDAWARKGDFECGRLRKIFQRPNDWRICSRHLEREAVSGGVKQWATEKVENSKFRNPKQIQMTKRQKITDRPVLDCDFGF